MIELTLVVDIICYICGSLDIGKPWSHLIAIVFDFDYFVLFIIVATCNSLLIIIIDFLYEITQ